MIRLQWELFPLDFWFSLFYTICNMCQPWPLSVAIVSIRLNFAFDSWKALTQTLFDICQCMCMCSPNLWMDFSTSFSYCMCVECVYGTETGLLSIHIIKLNYFYSLHAETCRTNYMILWFSPLTILSNIIKCSEACAEHTQISWSVIVIVSRHFSQLKI